MNAKKYRVLMVCMGNICRSPTAHGVFRHLVREAGYAARIDVDSAGTHAYHVGESPDPRAQQTARARGIDIRDLRARRAVVGDYHDFDLILAMDRENLDSLSRLCPPGLEHKLRLFLEFAPQFKRREVPDPYYGGPGGFDQVFDMVEAAAQGLLEHLVREVLANASGAGAGRDRFADESHRQRV